MYHCVFVIVCLKNAQRKRKGGFKTGLEKIKWCFKTWKKKGSKIGFGRKRGYHNIFETPFCLWLVLRLPFLFWLSFLKHTLLPRSQYNSWNCSRLIYHGDHFWNTHFYQEANTKAEIVPVWFTLVISFEKHNFTKKPIQ
jgi:hypothetical protein